jgi:hypothetical protein
MENDEMASRRVMARSSGASDFAWPRVKRPGRRTMMGPANGESDNFGFNLSFAHPVVITAIGIRVGRPAGRRLSENVPRAKD